MSYQAFITHLVVQKWWQLIGKQQQQQKHTSLEKTYSKLSEVSVLMNGTGDYGKYMQDVTYFLGFSGVFWILLKSMPVIFYMEKDIAL